MGMLSMDILLRDLDVGRSGVCAMTSEAGPLFYICGEGSVQHIYVAVLCQKQCIIHNVIIISSSMWSLLGWSSIIIMLLGLPLNKWYLLRLTPWHGMRSMPRYQHDHSRTVHGGDHMIVL